ncbi:metal ABC transporter permease [Patescibacteria group bacterium]|nr:metal ABC transporter permease [Patescibacteria group bacterium]MBU1922310.1 metal ABC transporter permease [Patescibacteria group bacterium]
MIEILQYPFMQRAILGGMILALLLAFMGIFVILRRMAFFGDGIAHASLAGIAIGLLAAYNPLIVAIGFGVALAIVIFYLERKTTLSSDVIIGILFTASMALGVVLISLKNGYQPELISFLFGNILAIKTSELVLMSGFAILVMIFLIYFYRQIAYITFDREGARVSGVNTEVLDLIFYIALAVAIVLGVKILGIVLVSALLIIPASCGKLVAGSFKNLVMASVIFAEITVLGGIGTSYAFNLPTGAIIILFGTALFFLILFGRKLFGIKS